MMPPDAERLLRQQRAQWAVERIRRRFREPGTELTMDEIDAEIEAVRRERALAKEADDDSSSPDVSGDSPKE